MGVSEQGQQTVWESGVSGQGHYGTGLGNEHGNKIGKG